VAVKVLVQPLVREMGVGHDIGRTIRR